MAMTLVQQKNTTSLPASATTFTETFNNPVVPGNLLAGLFEVAAQAAPASISDSVGNTWTAAKVWTGTNTGNGVGIYLCLSTKAGTPGVSFTVGSATQNVSAWVAEFNAGGSLLWQGLDGTPVQATVASASSLPIGPLTTAQAADLLLFLSVTNSISGTPSAGFTQFTASWNTTAQAGYAFETSAGSYTMTLSFGSGGVGADGIMVAVYASAPVVTGGVGDSLIGARNFWGAGFN